MTYSETIPVRLEGQDDQVDLDVEFTWSPGYPETGPSYASGGEPAEPDSFDVVSVKRDGAEYKTNAREDDVIFEWLQNNFEPPEPDFD